MKYIFTKNIAWQLEPTNEFIYCLEYKSNEYTIYENVAKDIWMCINKSYDIDKIIDIISQNYNVDKIIVREDTNNFLDELVSKEIIRIDE